MLSDRNVEAINKQIAQKLTKLNAFTTFESEKPELREEINYLMSLLNPQQSQDELLDALAAAILDRQSETPKLPSAAAVICELAFGRRR